MGIPKDYCEAFKWIWKSATNNDITGMFLLGSLYEDGLGTTKNIRLAMYWYKKAAEAGDEDALSRYNDLYDQGYRAATSPDVRETTSQKKLTKKRHR